MTKIRFVSLTYFVCPDTWTEMSLVFDPFIYYFFILRIVHRPHTHTIFSTFDRDWTHFSRGSGGVLPSCYKQWWHPFILTIDRNHDVYTNQFVNCSSLNFKFLRIAINILNSALNQITVMNLITMATLSLVFRYLTCLLNN